MYSRHLSPQRQVVPPVGARSPPGVASPTYGLSRQTFSPRSPHRDEVWDTRPRHDLYRPRDVPSAVLRRLHPLPAASAAAAPLPADVIPVARQPTSKVERAAREPESVQKESVRREQVEVRKEREEPVQAAAPKQEAKPVPKQVPAPAPAATATAPQTVAEFSPSARRKQPQRRWVPVAVHAMLAFAMGFAHIVGVLCAVGSLASMTTNMYGFSKNIGMATAPPNASVEPSVALSRASECIVPVGAYCCGGVVAELAVGSAAAVQPRHGFLAVLAGALLAAGTYLWVEELREEAGGAVYVVAVWTLGTGILNGMGAVYNHIRVTHYTGATTDIGVCIGRLLCRRDAGKLWILLPPWFSFIAGVFAGTVAWHWVGAAAMYGPAGGVALLGLAAAAANWRGEKQKVE